MTLRALFVLVAALGLAACGGGEEPLPEAANVEALRERPTAEQALYLAAYEIGQQVRQQDTTFNVDAFLRGLRAGFEADSALALPYALGYQQGLDLQNQVRTDTSLSGDLGLYVAGFQEGVADRERRLTPAEEQAVSEAMQMNQLRREALTNPQAQQFLAEIESSAAVADSFLTANAARDSVQTLPSGVQYIVREAGAGESPEEGDRVVVTYTGQLPDGTVFDSSQGQPVDFAIGETVPGFDEALQNMQIGSTWRIFLPPSLAYGVQGNPRGGIGPNSVLIFDVSLVDILDPVSEGGTAAPAVGAPQVQPGQ